MLKRLGDWFHSAHTNRRFRVLVVYLTGQGLVQFINMLTGFLLLRWLSVEYYAQFVVAFAFQTTLTFLTDLGFSGTIVALVGPRGNDPAVIGAYIRSGRRLRNIMLLIVTPIAAIVYYQIAHQHHWSALSSVLLFSSVVASIYFSGMVSYFGAPLLIHGRLSLYYRHQMAGALLRILSCSIIYLAGFLTAWVTSWINALGFLVIGTLYARESRPFAILPKHADPSITRQMSQYILPGLPSYLFFALQGQIALFLISFLGHTRNIAEVGALGRLGQLFLLLSGFNGTVIEPFIARQPRERVLRSFITITLFAVAICIPICWIGFYAPHLLLMLLGAKYSSLQSETGYLVLSSCIGYLVGLLCLMNAARRWVFWTASTVDIVLVLIAQILFLSLYHIDNTGSAILFGLATNIAYLLGALFNSVYGFIRGPRIHIPDSTPMPSTPEQFTGNE